MPDFDDIFFYEEMLDLIKEHPVEYDAWTSGKYYIDKPTHRSLTFSRDEMVPSHERFTTISQERGVPNSVSGRMNR